jgi:hypothetical protein
MAKVSWLILIKDIITVYSEDRKKSKDFPLRHAGAKGKDV